MSDLAEGFEEPCVVGGNAPVGEHDRSGDAIGFRRGHQARKRYRIRGAFVVGLGKPPQAANSENPARA